MDFTVHDTNTAPEASEPVLEKAEKKYGFALNLFGVLAESPAALKAYTTLSDLLDEDAELDAKQRQIAMLAISEENGCGYCMAAHSVVAEKMAGVPGDIVDALREGRDPADPETRALIRFVRAALEHRGWIPEEEQQAFLDAGFSKRAVLDVLTILALKTLSNYTNHLADTPLDQPFQPRAWSKSASS